MVSSIDNKFFENGEFYKYDGFVDEIYALMEDKGRNIRKSVLSEVREGKTWEKKNDPGIIRRIIRVAYVAFQKVKFFFNQIFGDNKTKFAEAKQRIIDGFHKYDVELKSRSKSAVDREENQKKIKGKQSENQRLREEIKRLKKENENKTEELRKKREILEPIKQNKLEKTTKITEDEARLKELGKNKAELETNRSKIQKDLTFITSLIEQTKDEKLIVKDVRFQENGEQLKYNELVAKLEKLGFKINQAKKIIHANTVNLEKLQTEKGNLQSEVGDLSDKITECEHEISTVNLDLESAQNDLNQIIDEETKLDKEIQEATNKINENNAKITEDNDKLIESGPKINFEENPKIKTIPSTSPSEKCWEFLDTLSNASPGLSNLFKHLLVGTQVASGIIGFDMNNNEFEIEFAEPPKMLWVESKNAGGTVFILPQKFLKGRIDFKAHQLILADDGDYGIKAVTNVFKKAGPIKIEGLKETHILSVEISGEEEEFVKFEGKIPGLPGSGKEKLRYKSINENWKNGFMEEYWKTLEDLPSDLEISKNKDPQIRKAAAMVLNEKLNPDPDHEALL